MNKPEKRLKSQYNRYLIMDNKLDQNVDEFNFSDCKIKLGRSTASQCIDTYQ